MVTENKKTMDGFKEMLTPLSLYAALLLEEINQKESRIQKMSWLLCTLLGKLLKSLVALCGLISAYRCTHSIKYLGPLTGIQ